jgi:hypothetical protein
VPLPVTIATRPSSMNISADIASLPRLALSDGIAR